MGKKVLVDADDLDLLNKKVKEVRTLCKNPMSIKKRQQKEISLEDYNKKMDKLVSMKLPVDEILVRMLQYASSVGIKEDDN